MKKRAKSGFKQSPAHQSQKRVLGETEVYLMGSVFYFWKSKFGISDKSEIRRAQVDKDVAGYVFKVLAREVPFGWHCEQLVRRVYSLQNAPFRKGTGRQEWFLNVNPIFGTAMAVTAWKLGGYLSWEGYLLSYFMPWVWIDGLIWLVFFRFLGWIAAIGLGAGTLWLYTNA